ncbi:MAG: SpoIIE family protein phosphatase [Verrucomicrobiales bacterium]|nr:SpoIIE family protein phosphatase [Verrucomicrobiales bacterium]
MSGSGAPDGADVSSLREEIASLQREESRYFSFLHEIAEAVSGERGLRRLPELIVSGVARVVEASGAALYLADKSGAHLVPKAFSKGCPPLVPLSAELLQESDPDSAALLSYLKLQPAAAGEGVLGHSFQSQSALNLARMDALPGFAADRCTPLQRATPVMVFPLDYGTKRLGVLAAANLPGSPAFTEHQFEMFRSVAEQSAFALGNAWLQEEASEKRRMEGELRAASAVQRMLLPEQAPELADFTVTATNVPARIVSGDYYDFLQIDPSHTGIVIADVSGKGIPASLVMTTCRGLLRGLAANLLSPAEALARVNRAIYEDVKEDMFISVAYLMLNHTDGTAILARAGHDAPLLFSQATGGVSRLEPPGVAMGVDDGGVFERVTKDYVFRMESGDCLLLYTDGVNEAENAAGDQLGIPAMEEVFRRTAPQGSAAVLEAILTAVADHVHGHPQSDDVTIIVVQRK